MKSTDESFGGGALEKSAGLCVDRRAQEIV
jgi:hypothetical protein